MGDISNTQDFKAVQDEKKMHVSKVLHDVYEALREKGYNPINQIVGYIMSGDPTYITSHKSARSLIMKVERDEILEELMENYIETRLKQDLWGKYYQAEGVLLLSENDKVRMTDSWEKQIPAGFVM